MKVHELIEHLETYPDDAEVRLMTQAHYPFEYDIQGTWESAPQPDACGECGLTEAEHPKDDSGIMLGADGHELEPYGDGWLPSGGVEAVYIVEGEQLGYGTKAAWDEVERP